MHQQEIRRNLEAAKLWDYSQPRKKQNKRKDIDADKDGIPPSR